MWFFTNPNDTNKFQKWIIKKTLTFNELSDEQQALINLVKQGKNVLVDACIGSGKTTTIQVLCDELPRKKILYLTYNRLLKIDAKTKIKSKNTIVTNYHGFASYSLLDSKIEVSGVSDIIQTYIRNFDRIKKRNSFNILLIDEYQDIDEEIAIMLTLIKGANPGIQIIAVGDMNQKIYDKTTLNAFEFINTFLEDHEVLNFTKCFRINAEFASRLGKIWNKNIVGVNNECEVKIMSFAQIKSFLEKQNTSDILCIGSRGGLSSKLLNMLESEHPEKFNKDTVYSSVANEDRGIRILTDNSVALFTTFDSSKGLERKICVILDFTIEYWRFRSYQNNIKYEILRNVFCVAASRGKSQIIFADIPGFHLLTDEMISKKFESTFHYNVEYYIYNMFEYNYKENIEECFKLLRTKKDETAVINEIDVKNNCGTIDLSSCINLLQFASFFKNYNIDEYIDMLIVSTKNRNPPNLSPNASIEEKVLYATTLNTKHERYIKQVTIPFVDDEILDAIHHRMSEVFDGNEAVQVPCDIEFMNNNHIQQIHGMCDVVKDDIVWTIRFETRLEHDHYLQCACYMVGLSKPNGAVWNIRTNERVFITIPDRKMFMESVAKSITKGVSYDVRFNIDE